MSRPTTALVVENLLFTVVVPGTVAVYLPMLLRGDVRGGLASTRLAAACFAVGLAVYGWCLWDFATFGRGTPAPIDAPKHLVVRGLYRYSRNPMYVGVLPRVARGGRAGCRTGRVAGRRCRPSTGGQTC
jgi:protein-S-isoprenylcysteine O-methyltransferase Ste14